MASASDFRMVAYQGQGVLGSEELNFSELLGRDKPVVLNFWAGLCPPCRQEMPGFQRVYDDLGDDVILVGVDVGPFVGLGSHEDARQFLTRFAINYPTAYAISGDAVQRYRVQSMPTTVFLTPDGDVFDRWSGFLSEDKLRSKIYDLLAASASVK